MATELLQLGAAITAHAWNSDCSSLALCANTNEVKIYNRSGNNFTEVASLKEHSQVVTGIAWSQSNKIVTSSQDRNAYVWEIKDGTWQPTLVILRINRAATNVKWCVADTKFAVSSGMKCISVCYYEQENNWWISKHIKKGIKSTVLSIDWAPDSVLLAAGSSDFKARIYCAAIKGVDKKPQPTVWEGKMAFGECIAEFDFGTSWVHDIAWAPSGEKLAFVSHDSCVTVVEGSGNMCSVKTRDLPYQCLKFLSENTLVAAGHDCNPAVYSDDGGCKWTFVCNLDSADKKAGAKTGGTGAAFAKFAQADKLGAAGAKATEMNTVHQNCIRAIVAMQDNFSTSALDGKVVMWDVKKLQSSVPAFKIK